MREDEVKVLVPWVLELHLNPAPLAHSSQEDISWVQYSLIKLMSWHTAARRLEKCMQAAGIDLSVFHTKAGLSLCPLWPSSGSTTASWGWPFPNAAYTSLLYCGKHCWIPDPRKVLLQRQYSLCAKKNPLGSSWHTKVNFRRCTIFLNPGSLEINNIDTPRQSWKIPVWLLIYNVIHSICVMWPCQLENVKHTYWLSYP